MKRLALAVAVAAMLPLCVLATHPNVPAANVKAAAKSGPILMQPGEIKYVDVPEMGPGFQMAVLRGNPDKAGPYTVRGKFADGFKIPPHWHPGDENMVILQGTFNLGMGDKWDDAKLTPLGKDAFVMLPKGVRHFGSMKGETVIELYGTGPFKTNWVNPPPKNK
jgi:hypothetical protein